MPTANLWDKVRAYRLNSQQASGVAPRNVPCSTHTPALFRFVSTISLEIQLYRALHDARIARSGQPAVGRTKSA